MNFIAPEHIIIACLTLVDSGARAVIIKCGTRPCSLVLPVTLFLISA